MYEIFLKERRGGGRAMSGYVKWDPAAYLDRVAGTEAA
jgi:hypothetical protein